MAHDLKYRSVDTGFASLERELRGEKYESRETTNIPDVYADLAEQCSTDDDPEDEYPRRQSPSTISWVPDAELPGYQQFNIPLPGTRTYPGEPEHKAAATLVRYAGPASSRVVLYAYGWSDCSFQTRPIETAESWDYDLYTLDLRRHGRSLCGGQLVEYTVDLGKYRQELDVAVEVICDEGHDHLVLPEHLMDGLAVSLFVYDRLGVTNTVVLNSPQLELQSLQAWRLAFATALGAAGTLSPTRALLMSDPGSYRRFISADEEREWHYSHDLKGDPVFLPQVGWISVAMRGYVVVATGLGIETSTLTLISARSDPFRTQNDDMHHVDLVLDVDALAARILQLDDHITLIRIHGGRYGLVLSQEKPRHHLLDETRRWLAAYGPDSVWEGSVITWRQRASRVFLPATSPTSRDPPTRDAPSGSYGTRRPRKCTIHRGCRDATGTSGWRLSCSRTTRLRSGLSKLRPGVGDVPGRGKMLPVELATRSACFEGTSVAFAPQPVRGIEYL